ncbi:probable methyltransferase PMT19 isoform X1 [Arachis stenosperma]|uniref:probable methyltransferase PMT19 isoform X1 n=2 Tax=Arachis stenosperma TaxID=217475 RepID=UPI0025ACDC46|nr:probable methyltransferase PMT19 isoform X1 [Arachis stenosperma]
MKMAWVPLPQSQNLNLRSILLCVFPCSLFLYLIYSYATSSSVFTITPQPLLDLDYSRHTTFEFCASNYTNYCPCHDPRRQKRFPKARMFRKERHCPQSPPDRLTCLIPRPVGYKTPFPWPQSKDSAWFTNVPFPKLVNYKKSQNWVRLEGDRFLFPGGGTSFPDGVNGYVHSLSRLLPLPHIRTALDVGCGVASFGAALMDYGILTMSIAPSDEHEGQVQFALERGLPAMLGVLSIHRLPFPSSSFDMAHCSRCLVPWTDNDGLYLREMDRILRPGGYWVLSGPPINWRVNYNAWGREAKELEKEQSMLEELAMELCWEKVAESDQFAVWQKPLNHMGCIHKLKTWGRHPKFCNSSSDPDPHAGWYTEMSACIFAIPEEKDTHRPRVNFDEDNRRWRRRVSRYGEMLKSLCCGRYRNVMDMNAEFGGFAATMAEMKYPVWVMNVVPVDAKGNINNNSLPIIFERGLIGTYMDWCEAFSTYPRTYDLIHACGIFSMYKDKCDISDILIEMHRIVRPKGALIIRDDRDVVMRVKETTDAMRWNGTLLSSGDSDEKEMILLVDNA